MKLNKKLNNLVLQYIDTKDDETFTEIYEIVAKTEWKKLATVARSVRADIHEITALYEDVLMKCIDRYNGDHEFLYFYRSSVEKARTDLYRKKEKQYEREEYETNSNYGDSIAATIECIADEVDIVTEVIKRADQRQLIDSLLSDADEITTAIAKTYVEFPNLGPTAIGKKLGLSNHSVVIRKLEKLASKFDSKKHGNYRDFLVAI